MRTLPRRLAGACTMLAALAALAAPALAQPGPPGGLIYANDRAWRTVGTPADLPAHGDFNVLYVLGGDLAPVSDAAPGDPAWRGGRWEVRPVRWTGAAAAQLTNAADVRAAAARGDLEVLDVARRFECPLVPAGAGPR